MSTQFFDRQADARKNTAWLVAMFVLCMVAIVVVAFAVTLFASEEFIRNPDRGQPMRLVGRTVHSDAILHATIAGLITASVISLGSLFKVLSLRAGGGRSVAESLGGQRLHPDSQELNQRRVLNIVEEMAIASGTPVPPVFLLDEDNVNAFAAGYSPSDAVIGVTRGATEQLNREELQGVIAHEFSHILNGDMRMNIRMIGILHGILLISLIGQMIMRSLWFTGGHRSRSDRDKGNGALVILAVGVALLVLGSVGSLLGGLLKAAVSRQREYLADASAVQFTRNPGGIAGALKRIGAISRGGQLNHPGAGMASHMFFAQGVFEGFTGLMATHPPLSARIKAIEPNWNGEFPQWSGRTKTGRPTGGARVASEVAAGFAGATEPIGADTASAPLPNTDIKVVDQASDHIGQPMDYHRRYADHLLDAADPVLIQHARESYSGRAVMFALLLDEDVSVRQSQIRQLSELVDPRLVALVVRLSPATDALSDQFRLPLVDLTLPALAAMSKPQYDDFVRSFDVLIKADAKISLFEWTLAQVLKRNLRPHFESVGRQVVTHYGLQRLGNELSVLFSTLARIGNTEGQEIARAFQCAASAMTVELSFLSPEDCDLGTLNRSLEKLNLTSERLRVQILDACADVICADDVVTVREAELLRGIADLLGCPMPPLIASDSRPA
ncbi:MAG: M48 family metallopeptidase [Planctomycetota bacterium]